MYTIETAQIFNIAGAVILFLGGIVLANIRSTVSTLKRNDDQIFNRLRYAESAISAINERCKERQHKGE